MNIESVFIDSISQQVNILVLSKEELESILRDLKHPISKERFIDWVLSTFVVSYASLTIKDKQDIYDRVVKLNKDLNPSKLFISKTNLVTCKTTELKLNKTKNWLSTAPDFDSYYNSNYNQIFLNLANCDHTIETAYSNELSTSVCIRKISKKYLSTLSFGISIKSEEDRKFWAVIVCIDNLSLVRHWIKGNSAVKDHELFDLLYELIIKVNPCFNTSVKGLGKLSKNTVLISKSEVETVNKYKSIYDLSNKDLLGLEEKLNDKIFGRTEAIQKVVSSVKKGYLGLKPDNKPIAVYLFYGPTGTGKTEFARSLASSLKANLAYVPCNSLIASHNVQSLQGAPPGYVGYEDPSILEQELKKGLFNILLFDEVEKAHASLGDFLLNILDEGSLRTQSGQELDFSQSLIILTSNIGQQEYMNSKASLGFESDSAASSQVFIKSLEKKFKPEFLSRLTDTIYFNELTESDYLNICQRYLEGFKAKLLKRNVTLENDPSGFVVKRYLETIKNPQGRGLIFFIEKQLVDQVAETLIKLGNKAKNNFISFNENLELTVSKVANQLVS